MPVLVDAGQWNKRKYHSYGNTQYYKNKDAVESVIRYISRTRYNDPRRNELIGVGGAGINGFASVEDIIQQFLDVQNIYGIKERQGRRVVHLIYSFSDQEFSDLMHQNFELINLIARDISSFLFQKGFQVFYGIHYDPEKHAHIHFAINSINYLDGKKYHSGAGDFKAMKEVFDQIVFYRTQEQKGVGTVCIMQ